MSKKVIFVHGHTSSSRKDWYPKLAKELDKLKVDYAMPDFPGGKAPRSKDWIAAIEREVRSADKPVVLVGHSLGTRAILLYLDASGQKVDTVILIAAPDNEVQKGRNREEGGLADFFEHELDLSKLRKSANKYIVVHSRDDGVVDYEEGVRVANGLKAELITHENRAHMSAPSTAKDVLDVLKKVLV